MIQAQRLRERRKELGYSVKRVACLSGLSERSYRRYEDGSVKNERGATLFAIATALQTSVSYLLGEEECAEVGVSLVSQDAEQILTSALELLQRPGTKLDGKPLSEDVLKILECTVQIGLVAAREKAAE